MSYQNFTNFNLETTPLTGDYLVGYRADGTAEMRTTVVGLVQSISGIINNNITPSFNPYTLNVSATAIQATLGNNSATGQYSVVEGGYCNLATGLYSNINGGTVNVAASAWSTVGGGNLNQALSGYSVVAGGWSNCAVNWASAIGGGYGNVASGAGSSVNGGLNNTASGNYSSIVGGRNNSTNSLSSTFVLGSYLSASQANFTYVNNISSTGAVATNNLWVGSLSATSGTPATVVAKMPIYNAAGTFIGWIPIYNN